jgi:hypothetical protein
MHVSRFPKQMQLVRPSLLQARNGRLVPDLGVSGIDAAPNSYGGSNVIAGSGQSVATAFCWTPASVPASVLIGTLCWVLRDLFVTSRRK